MRDYYIVSVVVGGIIYTTGWMLLEDAEKAAASFVVAAPNCSPQIFFTCTK